MVGDAGASKRHIRGQPKVKTGCKTCRLRRIKCDEAKPFCQKCVKTGRICDGYQSVFVHVALRSPRSFDDNWIERGQEPVSDYAASYDIAREDIDLLCRCFSTKTLLDVELGCDEEAKQLLEAGRTDRSVWHALTSLRTLREELETAGDRQTFTIAQSLRQQVGLQQYNLALGSLAIALSNPGFNGPRAALLCCQAFISIEQVQKNYAAMAQHMLQGLSIMHECRARPAMGATGSVLPAYPGGLPFLDVFIIKLCAAPCKFAEPKATLKSDCFEQSDEVPISQKEATTTFGFQVIAPDMRAGLLVISEATLTFLDKISRLQSLRDAINARLDKSALLQSLDLWLQNLDSCQASTDRAVAEPISTSFLRFFQIILKTILLQALDSSGKMSRELRTTQTAMLRIAEEVGEKVRDYPVSRNNKVNQACE